MIAVAPLSMALLLGVLTAVLSGRLQRSVSVVGSAVQLVLATWILNECRAGRIFSVAAGGWSAPFGVEFQVDLVSALMIWISAFLIFGTHIYNRATTPQDADHRYFESLWHFLSAGVYGSFSTADLFNLYVWFEILLLSSFVLMAMGSKVHQLKANTNYVLINLVGSAVFLLGLGFLYNSTGTLNFADLQKIQVQGPGVHWTAVALLIAFAMKAGAFPLFAWLPASYPFTPISSLGLFAGLLTKVGVYTLLRFFTTPSALLLDWVSPLLLVGAGLTMVIGVYGAAQEMTMRKILSFHIVSQIGYMLAGLALGTKYGVAGCIFYLMHHMIVKTNLFLITGAVEKVRGRSDLKTLGSVAKTHPLIAAAFAVSALSLAGLPPFSGFWAKLVILYSAAEDRAYLILGVGLLVGLLTFFSMLKIWGELFIKPDKNLSPASFENRLPWTMGLPILLFSLWTLILGIYPQIFLDLMPLASSQILKGVLE